MKQESKTVVGTSWIHDITVDSDCKADDMHALVWFII